MSGTRAAAMAWESLFRAQVAVMRRFQRDTDWSPIGIKEYDVLFTLSRAPDKSLRIRDLNEHVLISQPSLSRMVDRLAARDLVQREPAPDDGRGIVVTLTPAGAAMQREIALRHVRTIRAYVGGALTSDELATLEALCDKLRLAQAEIPDHRGDDA